MLRCIMGITNEGTFERGELPDGRWYTIDNITVKMSDGKRLKRYAVCLNGRWNSDQTMTLREARAEVARITDESNMRKTEEQNRKIERFLLETSDTLFRIKEQTGFSVSVAAYGDDYMFPCIFIHTNEGIVSIDERSEIEGFFNGEKWRNR